MLFTNDVRGCMLIATKKKLYFYINCGGCLHDSCYATEDVINIVTSLYLIILKYTRTWAMRINNFSARGSYKISHIVCIWYFQIKVNEYEMSSQLQIV